MLIQMTILRSYALIMSEFPIQTTVKVNIETTSQELLQFLGQSLLIEVMNT